MFHCHFHQRSNPSRPPDSRRVEPPAVERRAADNAMNEKRAAVAAVLGLLPEGDSADTGADAGTPANDPAAAAAARIAN
jgi:hypothetical protein